MIAGGLCVMGGCYAQNEDSGCAASYWPAQYVEIPVYTASASIGLFEPSIPADADQTLFYANVLQQSFNREDTVSVFFARQYKGQGVDTVLNAYHSSPVVEVTNNRGGLAQEATGQYTFPLMLRFVSHGGDGAFPDISEKKVGAGQWNATADGWTRVLDARAYSKGFFYSYGYWGIYWYMLPMRSPENDCAAFDFVSRTLVEM